MRPFRWPEPTRRSEAVVAAGLVAFTALSCGLCVFVVNFRPQVSPYFFFSREDPQLQAERAIAGAFEQSGQLVLSARGDLESADYLRNIDSLTESLEELPEVVTVLSLAHGPNSLQDARASPLWRRILLTADERASHVIAFIALDPSQDRIAANPSERLIADVERIAKQFDRDGFRLVLSGMPYIVELMRRYLARDLRVFFLAAFFVFGALIMRLVRSLRMVLGMLAVCLSAGAVTLLVTQVFHIRVGLLTANLATIVLTMTLSHLVFMTFNWQHLREREPRNGANPVGAAVRMTFPASFWSMSTTLLGFVSLCYVQAEPLRRLGVSGIVGTLVALAVAYLVYPWVLWLSREHGPRQLGEGDWPWLSDLFARRHRAAVSGAILICLILATGIARLQTDPTLLSYFAAGSPLRNGLEYVDSHLGSSPLTIVVSDPAGKKFVSTEMYQRLWELHLRLEQDQAVGSIVSLPVIMAEARRLPLIGAWLPWDWLLKLMELPQTDRIAKYFVNGDRTQGLFLLLMREAGRVGSRLATVARLKDVVQTAGFAPHLVGGVYVLQGKLSRLVVSSLLWGLLSLGVAFFGLVWGWTRSWRIAAAVVGSVALIPLWMLGLIGYLRMPFDVISAPAANLAVGMGIDSLLHLMNIGRRVSGPGPIRWEAWVEARNRMWRPITTATVVVCAGFGVFGLSAFPPTQRFGLSIVLGTLLVPVAALFVLPALASREAPDAPPS
ncbi:MAG: MMPL family transporter [Candidatus Omnitrophica bacterium]|nr:MMPL family transporter [Candidatus Omnitrophota bacterium]